MVEWNMRIEINKHYLLLSREQELLDVGFFFICI